MNVLLFVSFSICLRRFYGKMLVYKKNGIIKIVPIFYSGILLVFITAKSVITEDISRQISEKIMITILHSIKR